MNKCKTCNQELIKKSTKKKVSQLQKPFYYSAYWYCTNCNKIYHDDAFKVLNENLKLFNADLSKKKDVDIEIWTDGACVYNGTENARAAWAFVAEKYEEKGLVDGKQTNNTAEAYAIYYALVWAGKRGYKRIRVYTDSQITLHGLQKPIEKIKENREIFYKIQEVIREYKLTIYFEKVSGHSGDVNNERADRLATSLASNTRFSA